jgi:hypothetical protein
MSSADRPTLDELAAGALDEADLAALARLAEMYSALDPVPPRLVERIQFGITLDALHAEIAELQRSGDLAGVRSDDLAQAQTVTFTSTSLTTMVTITPLDADQARVDGWVAPGAAMTVELRVVGGVLTTVCDEDGRFVFDAAPRGLAQFVIRSLDPTAKPVITPSIDL